MEMGLAVRNSRYNMLREQTSAAPSSRERSFDPWLIGAVVVLLGMSVLMVFSTTAVPSEQTYGSPTTMIRRHIAHILVGLCSFFLALKVNPRVLYRLALPVLCVALCLLMLVLIPGVGYSAEELSAGLFSSP